VNDVVAGLGRLDNPAGLWQLARAANSFQATRRAVNSYSPQETLRTPPSPDTYVVPRLNPVNPSELAVDDAGKPEPLRPYDVVYLSDPARAETEMTKKDSTKRPKLVTETTAAKAVRLRAAARASLKAGLGDLEALTDLGHADVTLQPVLGDLATWRDLIETIEKINGLLYANQPAMPSLVDDLETHEDDPEDGLV
jgi:hypothetical protein